MWRSSDIKSVPLFKLCLNKENEYIIQTGYKYGYKYVVHYLFC